MNIALTPIQLAMCKALDAKYSAWTAGKLSQTAQTVFRRRNRKYLNALESAKPQHIGHRLIRFADKPIVDRLGAKQ